jgi:hypothetical protein
VREKVPIDSSFDTSGLNSTRDFFRISAEPPTILIEDLGGFPQSSKATTAAFYILAILSVIKYPTVRNYVVLFPDSTVKDK